MSEIQSTSGSSAESTSDYLNEYHKRHAEAARVYDSSRPSKSLQEAMAQYERICGLRNRGRKEFEASSPKELETLVQIVRAGIRKFYIDDGRLMPAEATPETKGELCRSYALSPGKAIWSTCSNTDTWR